MVSLYDVKPRFQAVLRPYVVRLAAAGVTANQVTVGAAALSVATGVLILWAAPSPYILLLLPVVLFVRMALNAVDGMLAREHGQASRLGALLNELGDIVSDAALYMPMAAVLAAPGWLAIGAPTLGITAEAAGIAAVTVGSARRYDGPMGKSDRAAAFGLLAFIIGIGIPQGSWVGWVLAVIAVLAVVTVVRRVRAALSAGSAGT